ncbi:hypothetical protein E4U59_003357 [Claviceps monticola]|nr:hypothetical protein E4U59_003357 [Claviceps monticola]
MASSMLGVGLLGQAVLSAFHISFAEVVFRLRRPIPGEDQGFLNEEDSPKKVWNALKTFYTKTDEAIASPNQTAITRRLSVKRQASSVKRQASSVKRQAPSAKQLSWIMDHGSWIMDHGSWIMDARYGPAFPPQKHSSTSNASALL